MKKVLINYLNFGSGEALSRVFNFLTVVYLTRVLSIADFGKINLAQSLGMYCLLIVSYGFEYIGLREVAKHRHADNIKSYVNNIITIRTALFSMSYLFLSLAVFFMAKPFGVKAVILLYSLIAIPYVFDLLWVFQSLEKMHVLAAVKTLNGFFLFVCVICLVRTNADVFSAAICYPIALLPGMLVAILLFYRKIGGIKFEVNWSFWVSIFKEATPVFLILVMNTFSFNIPLITLGFMHSDKDLALFSAAYKVFLISVVPLGIWYQTCAPRLAKSAFLSVMFKRYAAGSLCLAAVIALAVFLLSSKIILILYGQRYHDAILLLKIMAISVFLSGFLVALASPLVMWGYQKYHLFACVVGAFCIILSSLYFVKRYGAIGASVASIISDSTVILTVLIFFVTKKKVLMVSG